MSRMRNVSVSATVTYKAFRSDDETEEAFAQTLQNRLRRTLETHPTLSLRIEDVSVTVEPETLGTLAGMTTVCPACHRVVRIALTEALRSMVVGDMPDADLVIVGLVGPVETEYIHAHVGEPGRARCWDFSPRCTKEGEEGIIADVRTRAQEFIEEARNGS